MLTKINGYKKCGFACEFYTQILITNRKTQTRRRQTNKNMVFCVKQIRNHFSNFSIHSKHREIKYRKKSDKNEGQTINRARNMRQAR